MPRKRISWTDLQKELDSPITQADKQWCLEEAIDLTKEAAAGGAKDLPQLLQDLYEKLKELGKDAWSDSRNISESEEALD
jgi:hypothetical protein